MVMDFPGHVTFVGRASELASLDEALADPRVRAVLISGEAGIGKSRLVAEFASRVAGDALVLVGYCPELGEGGVPYAPFIAALRSLQRQLGVGELAALLPKDPAIGRWLPELAMRTSAEAPLHDPMRLSGEILALLEQLALTRRVILVLEDLHWADTSSRELLAFLVGNLAQDGILVVGTYRPAPAEHLQPLIAELRRQRNVKVVSPRPLTRHEVGRQLAALLDREPAPAVITRVAERSGGNPLFVEALSRSPEQLPAGLTDLLLGFLAGLSAPSLSVLRVAAVIGSSVDHELLAEISGLPKAALHDALRELIDQGLVLATDTGYDFRHALIRQAVYEGLLPAERTSWHARLADLIAASPGLLSAGDRDAELARHAAAAGDRPSALAAFWRAAAASGSAGAHARRLRELQRVAELWDAVPDARQLTGADKLDVVEAIVEACVGSGEVERGIQAAGAALVLVDRAADPRRAAHLHYCRAQLRSQTGEGPGEDLKQALRLLPEEPVTLERGEIIARLAVFAVFGGDPGAAAAHARNAVAIADQLGATALAARAHAYLGLAAAGEPDTAVAHFDRARAAATASGDFHVLLDVVTWESAVLLAAGDYEAVIAVVQRGMRIAHDTFRFSEVAPILLVKWVQALTALSRWPQALMLVDEAELDHLPPLSYAALLLCRARIALGQGDMAAARRAAEHAEGLLGDGQWARSYRLQLLTVQCLIAFGEGDREGAAAVLAQGLAACDSEVTLTAHPHDAWPLVALSAQVPGAPPELTALAGSLPAASPVDAAYQAVHAAHSRPSAARWEAAAGRWRALRQPYEEAQCLLGAAECNAADGNRDAAQAALRRGGEIAVRLGADPLGDAVRRLAQRARLSTDHLPGGGLGQRDGNGDGGQRPGRFGLTSRELDVLRLVAAGRTNRQIAVELFISINTAGVHVSRILAKVGAATRTEAAAFAREHDLVGAAD
jgi:ATP/maltotriose-dependent transcriptional regulator MalT